MITEPLIFSQLMGRINSFFISFLLEDDIVLAL
jgi:hypothetical protein